jgi:hypothetical protein
VRSLGALVGDVVGALRGVGGLPSVGAAIRRESNAHVVETLVRGPVGERGFTKHTLKPCTSLGSLSRCT